MLLRKAGSVIYGPGEQATWRYPQLNKQDFSHWTGLAGLVRFNLMEAKRPTEDPELCDPNLNRMGCWQQGGGDVRWPVCLPLARKTSGKQKRGKKREEDEKDCPVSLNLTILGNSVVQFLVLICLFFVLFSISPLGIQFTEGIWDVAVWRNYLEECSSCCPWKWDLVKMPRVWGQGKEGRGKRCEERERHWLTCSGVLWGRKMR